MLVMLILIIVVNVKNLKIIPSFSFCWFKFISCATLLPNRVNIHSDASSQITSTYHRLVRKQCMLARLKSLISAEMLTRLGSNIAQELNFKQFYHIFQIILTFMKYTMVISRYKAFIYQISFHCDRVPLTMNMIGKCYVRLALD